MKVLLVCAGGMSTAIIKAKMREVAEQEKFDLVVDSIAFSKLKEKYKDYDVILVAPQVRHLLDKVKEEVDLKPVADIPFELYGKMDGKGVLEIAKRLIG